MFFMNSHTLSPTWYSGAGVQWALAYMRSVSLFGGTPRMLLSVSSDTGGSVVVPKVLLPPPPAGGTRVVGIPSTLEMGNSAVAAQVCELMAYSTQGSCSLNLVSVAVIHLNTDSRCWSPPACPVVCG